MNPEIPLACNMSVFTPAQRAAHIRTITQLFSSTQGVEDAENGFEFTLPNQTDMIIRLGEFIANERLCCPFLRFMFTIEPGAESIFLLLTGPEGTQDFLRAEFSEAFA